MSTSVGSMPTYPHSIAVPVIDLFAGPGGLGEGFSSITDPNGLRAFRIALSIEKDPVAHRTLSLRAMFRHFGSPEDVPEVYYDYIRGESLSRLELERHPEMRDAVEAATVETRCAALGEESVQTIDSWIHRALGGRDNWVLIGGPPCQAYSLVGRARQARVARSVFEKDHRHLLYREYLRIISKFNPAVFVMENVKGILSAKLAGSRIFPKILGDLALGGRYQIRSFVIDEPPTDPREFVIRAERYGIPQSRHRVILLGVRSDLQHLGHVPLQQSKSPPPSVADIIEELPPLRSRLSPSKLDSTAAWQQNLRRSFSVRRGVPRSVAIELRKAIAESMRLDGAGGRFVPETRGSHPRSSSTLLSWLKDARIGGWCNHDSRGHMGSDLHRYLYAAAYARVYGKSPKVRDFPEALWPDHKNILEVDPPFLDRFRVQLSDRPSTTVMSHIAKDGHYFIHPDPSQSRSLTVREAARLQTFPDNYFFEGGRTDQFTQVGNAVPPFLARQLAEVVQGLLEARQAELQAVAA